MKTWSPEKHANPNKKNENPQKSVKSKWKKNTIKLMKQTTQKWRTWKATVKSKKSEKGSSKSGFRRIPKTMLEPKWRKKKQQFNNKKKRQGFERELMFTIAKCKFKGKVPHLMGEWKKWKWKCHMMGK